ncbi:unnamed protein product [Durusdinium trenchii]|uniref:Uncharacterized protein n=1 Tax=Durusdinium trenchii TaxID=1381693 RepID=A0ABP0LPH1_9DINO
MIWTKSEPVACRADSHPKSFKSSVLFLSICDSPLLVLTVGLRAAADIADFENDTGWKAGGTRKQYSGSVNVEPPMEAYQGRRYIHVPEFGFWQCRPGKQHRNRE